MKKLRKEKGFRVAKEKDLYAHKFKERDPYDVKKIQIETNYSSRKNVQQLLYHGSVLRFKKNQTYNLKFEMK